MTLTVPQRLASASTPVSFRVTVWAREAAVAWATGTAIMSAQREATSVDLMEATMLAADERNV